MSVETTATYSGPLAANGVTTAFSFAFKAMGASEVVAIGYDEDGEVVELPDFSVSLTDPGGTVTFEDAPDGGLSIYLLSDPSFLQQIEFENGSRWLAGPVNEANDRAAVRTLYLKRQVSRALLVPVGETPLEVGDIAEGQALVRVGNKLVGAANSAGEFAVAAAQAIETVQGLRDEVIPAAAQVAEDAGQVSEDAAQVVEDRAETEAFRNETQAFRDAALAGASGTYADTAAGLADTSEGEYFTVPATPVGYMDLYLHEAGPTATLIDTMPNAASVTRLAPLKEIIDSTVYRVDGIPSPTLSNGNGGFEANADACFLLSEKSGRNGTLRTLKAHIDTLGNGDIYVVLATGALGGSLTFVRRVQVEALATGEQSFSDVISRTGTEHALLSVPAGGPFITLLSNAGEAGYYSASGNFTSGTKTLSATAGKVLSVQAEWDEGGEVSITSGDLASSEQMAFEGLTDALVDADVIYGREDVLYAQSGVPAGRMEVVAEIDRKDTIKRIEAYFTTTGTAKIVHGRGGPGLPYCGYVMSIQNLTVSATGETVWTDGEDGYTAIQVEDGDQIAIWTPTTGGALLSRDATVTGISEYYASPGDTAPIEGNPMVAPVSGGWDVLANRQVMARAIGTKKTFDLAQTSDDPPSQFLLIPIISQSQWASRGVTGTSPAIPDGVAYDFHGGVLTAKTGDPFGNSSGSGYSPVPALINSIYERSGGKVGVIIVNLSVLGSSVLAVSNPSTNWSPTGTLTPGAITKINAARAAAQAAGMVWKDGPIIFDIGYTDGDAIAAGTSGATKANYKAGVLNLVAALETGCAYGAGMLPVVMSRTGWTTSGGVIVSAAAYGQIQDAQDEICREHANFTMGYRGAYTWVVRSILDGDYIHAGTVARDEMGTDCGITVYRVSA